MKSLIIAVSFILTSLAVSAQTAPAVAPANAIVFVNSDSLINNYDYYKAVRVKLQDLSQKAQAEINTKGAAFQKEV